MTANYNVQCSYRSDWPNRRPALDLVIRRVSSLPLLILLAGNCINVISSHTISLQNSGHDGALLSRLSGEYNSRYLSRRQANSEAAGVEDKAGNTLQLVQILFRHGDRSAIHTYPTDPHQYDWPQGLGQLTQIGMMQAYQLGLYLRHRYQDFLSENYKHEEVYIRSTDYDRTLMTAQCVAAGLFPFNVSDQKNLALSWPVGTWQPVPVQTVPGEKDALLHPSEACEFIESLEETLKVSYATEQSIIKKKDLMFMLSRNTGMDINVTSLHYLADTVFCQLQHNMSQPKWMSPDIINQLLDYREHTPAIVAEDAKYLSGYLLNTMIENMEQKVNNASDPHKIYLFSAHDSTVEPLMNLLQISDHLQVPYTAAVIVELHLINQQPFVKLLFRNDTALPAYDLVAKRCGVSPCPLNVFHVMHDDYLLTDEAWNEICPDSSSGNFYTEDNTIPILVAALVALIGLNVFLGFKAYSVRQHVNTTPEQQYSLLRTLDDSSDSEMEMTMTSAVDDHSGTNGGTTLDLGTAVDENDRKEEEEMDNSFERESI